MQVTNENVITFIHLVSNHRLNFQIRQQSSHFLRGFQQLIPKECIDMFNEHELQVLISGSADSLDIDDLRQNTNYTGGYNAGHYVIDMFWEVLKKLLNRKPEEFLKICDRLFREDHCLVSNTWNLHSVYRGLRVARIMKQLIDYLHQPLV
uniref:HECT-type E3 ubiquitin transferase n=1 Tax=Brassica oleracea TaxID=3712 RepID=A0A3P6F1E7_BRAOL|nr:unnamed protein product [Brassica oleracea]